MDGWGSPRPTMRATAARWAGGRPPRVRPCAPRGARCAARGERGIGAPTQGPPGSAAVGARARAGASPSGARVAVVIVDHGSRREASNAMLATVVDAFRRRGPEGEGFVAVEPAHMELAEPSIATAVGRCVAEGATRVVVTPFFLAPGRHIQDDIPALVAEAARAHPGVEVRIAEPLGTHPLAVDILHARVAESLGGGGEGAWSSSSSS